MADLEDQVARDLMIENYQMREMIKKFNTQVLSLKKRNEDLEDQIEKLKSENEIKAQVIENFKYIDSRKDIVIGRLASKPSFHKWLDASDSV